MGPGFGWTRFGQRAPGHWWRPAGTARRHSSSANCYAPFAGGDIPPVDCWYRSRRPTASSMAPVSSARHIRLRRRCKPMRKPKSASEPKRQAGVNSFGVSIADPLREAKWHEMATDWRVQSGGAEWREPLVPGTRFLCKLVAHEDFVRLFKRVSKPRKDSTI